MSPLAYAILATIQKETVCILIIPSKDLPHFDKHTAKSCGVNLDTLLVMERKKKTQGFKNLCDSARSELCCIVFFSMEEDCGDLRSDCRDRGVEYVDLSLVVQ